MIKKLIEMLDAEPGMFFPICGTSVCLITTCNECPLYQENIEQLKKELEEK